MCLLCLVAIHLRTAPSQSPAAPSFPCVSARAAVAAGSRPGGRSRPGVSAGLVAGYGHKRQASRFRVTGRTPVGRVCVWGGEASTPLLEPSIKSLRVGVGSLRLLVQPDVGPPALLFLATPLSRRLLWTSVGPQKISQPTVHTTKDYQRARVVLDAA